MSIFRRTVGLASLALTCAACTPEHYLDRRETISLAAGDAVHANMVTHIADPWPRHAFDNRIVHEGEVIQKGVQRLREGKVYDPRKAPGGLADSQGQGGLINLNIGGGAK